MYCIYCQKAKCPKPSLGNEEKAHNLCYDLLTNLPPSFFCSGISFSSFGHSRFCQGSPPSLSDSATTTAMWSMSRPSKPWKSPAWSVARKAIG